MNYLIKIGSNVVAASNAKEAAAKFLWRKQQGHNPEWLDYPGNYESVDFYTISFISDRKEHFLAIEGENKVLTFDSEDDAYAFVKLLHSDKRLYVCQGGITSDGFVAGLTDLVLDISPYDEDWIDPYGFEE